MSVLLQMTGARRIVAGGGPPPDVTIVAAQLVNYTGASGEQRVSSGFPVPPGLVTSQMIADRDISVLVGGTEVACNVRAIRGDHQDGTPHSIEIQLLHTFPDASETPVTNVEVHFGRRRTTTDLSYVPLTYARFFDPCAILPTDPTYLCSTWLTMQPLLPDADADATSAEWFQDFFDFLAKDPIDIGNGVQPGRLQDRDSGSDAHYAHPRALLARWCKTGDAFYWRWANRRFTGRNPLANNTQNPSESTRGFYWSRIATQATGWDSAASFNPEGITQSAGTSEAVEQFRMTVMDFPPMYWATGYGYLWNSVSNMAMRAASFSSSNTYNNVALGSFAMSGAFGFRFNTTLSLVWLAAYVMDATGQAPVGTGYSGGVPRATPTDLRSLLEWCMEAWDRNRWDDSNGAYREGLRGARITAWDGARFAPGDAYEGTMPIFQLAVAANVFIDIYLNLKDCVDPLTAETTKERVRDNLRAVIRCTRRLTAGDGGQFNQGPAGLNKWGITYLMTETPGVGWNQPNESATKQAGFVGGGSLGSLSTDAGAATGTWQVECTNATVPATWEVRRPNGTVEGTATTGVAYNGAINFTITARDAAFAVGDRFNVALVYQTETIVSPNLLPMFLRAAAFCAHFYPTETTTDLDGVAVTYEQFYARMADPDVLRNSVTFDIQYAWKTFGEYFGSQMDCDYFRANGVPAAPSAPRPTTNYDGQLWSPV